jgi:hypothetical protein
MDSLLDQKSVSYSQVSGFTSGEENIERNNQRSGFRNWWNKQIKKIGEMLITRFKRR